MNLPAPPWAESQFRLKSSCGFIRHARNHRVKEDWFKNYLMDYDCWLVSEGNAWLKSTESNEPEQLQRGSVVFFRPGELFTLWQDKGAQRLALNFFHFDVVRIPCGTPIEVEEWRAVPRVLQSESPEWLEMTAERVHRLATGWRADGQPSDSDSYEHAGLLLKALLSEAYIQTLQNGGAQPSVNSLRYRQVAWILSELRRDPIRFRSVKEIAAHCHISEDYCARLFQRCVGITPLQAIIQSRIEKAKLFLVGSELTISQIAEELGYRNIYFFSRQFKEQTQQTPSAYRAQSWARGLID